MSHAHRFHVMVAQSALLSEMIDKIKDGAADGTISYWWDDKIPCLIVRNPANNRWYDVQEDVEFKYTMLEQYRNYAKLEDLVRAIELQEVEDCG